uniref:Uncharacterized protein n=1 Tax=Lutzomyia longipalpis TaxID=7200 RepID=A0A1B0CHE0_LUTLO
MCSVSYSNSRLDSTDVTTGRQLQRILHYSITPCRPLPTLRRSECAIHDVDCDEVYPKIYIGDANSKHVKQLQQHTKISLVKERSKLRLFILNIRGMLSWTHRHGEGIPLQVTAILIPPTCSRPHRSSIMRKTIQVVRYVSGRELN